MPLDFISSLFKSKDPVIIDAYGGYANDLLLHAKSRVLEDEGIEHHESDSALKSIWNSYKRFESDEKSDVSLTADWGDGPVQLISDEEGYVQLTHDHNLKRSNKENLWIPLTYSMERESGEHFSVSTEILKPGTQNQFGVISDVDDTLLDTGVSSAFKWRLMVNSIASHAHKRSAMEGAIDLYKALHKGSTGKGSNPIFYVSNSPWNIHGYLSSFLSHNDFPKGPLILREINLGAKRSEGFESGVKYKSVMQIMETYPKMKFVLLGDAAELDADIYLSIADKRPNQVECILIRAVDSTKRMERIKSLIDSVSSHAIFLMKDTAEGIDIARNCGLIA